MEKTDWLWPGGVRYVYDEAAFRPGTDTFLLGAFPKLWRGARVCDLGAGIGLLCLLLLSGEVARDARAFQPTVERERRKPGRSSPKF